MMSNDCTNIATILYLASNFLELMLKTYIHKFSHLLFFRSNKNYMYIWRSCLVLHMVLTTSSCCNKRRIYNLRSPESLDEKLSLSHACNNYNYRSQRIINANFIWLQTFVCSLIHDNDFATGTKWILWRQEGNIYMFTPVCIFNISLRFIEYLYAWCINTLREWDFDLCKNHLCIVLL